VSWRRGSTDSDVRLDIKEVLFFPAMKPDTTHAAPVVVAPDEKVRTCCSTECVTDPLSVVWNRQLPERSAQRNHRKSTWCIRAGCDIATLVSILYRVIFKYE